jgi:uncharacterized protein with HEPN domain
MQRDRLYLLTIVDALAASRRIIGAATREELPADETLSHALKSVLLEVGEAAACLSAGLKQRHPDIPWKGVVDFRNVLVHAYFSVRWELAWEAATGDLPTLGAAAQRILDSAPAEPP